MASKTVVIAWGSGEDGQMGIGNSEEKEWVCAISALGSSNVCSVVAGSRNSLAICDDGKVAAGGTHSVIFTREGDVWTWGQPWPPGDIKQISTPVRVQGLDSVRLIAVGAFHNLALLDDGTLMAWGNNEYGQLGTGDTQPRSQPIPVQGLSDLTLVNIAAGGWHSTALTDDGEVYAWGRGEHGKLGFGDDKSSKMVPQRVQLLVGEDIVQVSCGGTHSVALTWDGRMYSFGRGDHGRLGYGRKVTTGHPAEVPIAIPPPKSISVSAAKGRWCAKLVACGGRHTLAIAEWHVSETDQVL
ncbi:ultraviolet-B receptor UVR8-like [Primulina tabacum]|uniref:ultraviolet-B receptor UVR8-like n=1 Tax=Primulina tabacum TaxID=48773 RepID=UPI003F5A40C3